MILTGSRASPLAQAQFDEIQKEVGCLLPVWVKTVGDFDRTTSLRGLGKTDFFTKEIDEMVLSSKVRIAIHSAKDLPNPLPKGLRLVALTKGLDPRDSLVFRQEESLNSLALGSLIATSSQRREDVVKALRSDFSFTDLRGTIQERLLLLDTKKVDGLVVAEAALIRLKLTHLSRLILEGETTPMQGRLAVLARENDLEMRDFFAALFRS